MKKHRILTSSLALFAAVLPSHADYFWDGTDLTVDADGGSGVWDTSTLNWDTLATAGVATAWSDLESANFGGAAGTVSIAAGGITAANVVFATDGYTIEGSTLAVGSGAITTPAGIGATIKSPLIGTSGLTKSGEGTLTLAGISTYTGATRIHAGTLKLSPIQAYRYYRFTVATNFGNGSSTLDGYNQIGELHYYNAGVWTPATTGSASGPGTGEQLWSNANDNRGANVAGFTKYGFGTRPYSITYDFGTATAFDGYNWSTANDSTPARNPRRWTVSGSNDNVNFAVLDDRSTANQPGPTALYTWSGGTGTYLTNDNGVDGGGANAYGLGGGSGLPTASALEIAGGATFDLNGLNQATASLSDLGGGGGSVVNGATTKKVVLAVGSANSTTFSGTISDTGAAGSVSLLKVGAGSQTLAGSTSNTYSGNTTLGGTGRLVLAKTDGAIAIPGDIDLSSSAFGGNNAGVVLAGDEQIADTALLTWTITAYGGTAQADTFFRLNGHTETVGGLVTFNTSAVPAIENRGFNDTETYGTGTLIIDVAADTTHTYSGQIRNTDASTNGNGGTIALTKTGPGTQILAGGMGSCTGPALVDDGVLRINGLLGSSTITVTGSGTLQGTGTLSGLVTVQSGGILSPGAAGAGTLSAANPVAIANGGTLALSGTTLNGAATIAGGGLLTGTGTVASSVQVQAGAELAPGTAGIGTLNVNGTLELAGNATFELNKAGATLTGDRVSGFSKVTYGGTLTLIASGDAPQLGDVYPLFSAGAGGTYAGAFSSISGLPALPAGLQWETTSLLTDGTIKVIDTASSPAFGPAPGGYVGAQSVTITSDSGSTIYYTLDGSEPTLASTSSSSPLTGITVPVDSVVTVKAFATTPGFGQSPVVTAVYRTVTVPKWNVDAAGNWSTAANWANEVIPNGNQMTADFTLAQTAARTVTLDTNRIIGGLSFANANPFAWTLTRSGSNVLTLNVPSGSPVIDVQDIATQDPDTTISAVLAGTQGFTKTGPGILALGIANTFSGTLVVNGGTVSVATLAANGANSPLGSGNTLRLDGGTLRYTGAGSVGAGTFNRAVILGEGGGTINTSTPANFWFTTGPFSGPGSLTKIGSRQLIIQSNNSYDGDTFIQEGEFQIRTIDALGSTAGKTVVNSPARLALGTNIAGTINETLELNGLGGGNGAFQCNDGGVAVNWAGPISLVTDSGVGGATAGLTLSGPISGDGGLGKFGANTITLAGAASNTYAGLTTLSGNGKLVLAKTDGAIAIPGNIQLSSTASNPGGGNNSGILLAGDEQIADTAVLTWTTTFNTYFRLNGRTETIGGLVAATGTPGASAIENRGFGDTGVYPDGNLVINTTGTNAYSYAGVIRDTDPNVTGAGVITLTKNGSGSQALSGTLTYTGATTVNGGTLEIGSASATPITVNTGATLKGSGSTNKSLTVNSGGTLAPGASAGTFGAGDTVIAGSYACEIDGAAADRLTVTGSLNVTGATLDLTVLNPPTAASYVIASYTTDLTGTFEVTGLPAGYRMEHLEAAKQIVLVEVSFAGWAALNGLSGDPVADFDKDGLPDAVEYVLGSSPTEADGGAPVGSVVGENLVFTFTRDDASLTPDIEVAVEVGTSLATWPDVYEVGEDTASSDEGIVVTDNGSSDTITLTVPVAPDPKKFARLVVTVAP
jgi:autotransporter-associated beta strand protein